VRVVVVVAGPYPALRGSQVLVRHLERGLAERGHEVAVVTYGPHRGRRPGPRPARVALDALLVLRLHRHVRRHGADVIHAHNYEAAIAGLLVGRLCGVPLVYHGHSALVQELPTYASSPWGRRWLRQLGALLDGQVPRRADFCIAVTEELGRLLRAGGVLDRSLACIEPANQPSELVPDEGAREEAGRNGDGLVCYAGNLDGYQNLGFLFDAFARVRAELPAARLVLVTHADARRHAARLGEGGLPRGVEIVEATSYHAVRDRLAEADVAVLPRSEGSGFPMKLLNYMAAGKAIVASAGSAKGLRDGRTGRVVPDGDAAAFAAAVVELLHDGGQRARLGRAARRAVEDPAAWEQVLDRIESIYHNLVAPRIPTVLPATVRENIT
jgi:glycosyltransferase involved in cell wall biosynthesis